jgi:hypothetical protein
VCPAFAFLRTVTCILRIISTCFSTEISPAIAELIFLAFGVIILFVLNICVARQVINTLHHRIARHRLEPWFYSLLWAWLIITIILLLTSVVEAFYTLNTDVLQIDRNIELYGLTTFAVFAFLPILIIILTYSLPHPAATNTAFAYGNGKVKVAILMIGSGLIAFGAWYRVGVSYLDPVSILKTLPGVLGIVPFYVVNFTVEVLTLAIYALGRLDRCFDCKDTGRDADHDLVEASRCDAGAQGLEKDEHAVDE